MHVALLANLKQNAPTWPGMSPDQWDDLDSEKTTHAIMAALESAGHRVTFLEGDVTLYDRLRDVRPDICFNICEGHFGDSREAQVPALSDQMHVDLAQNRRKPVGVVDEAIGIAMPYQQAVWKRSAP